MIGPAASAIEAHQAATGAGDAPSTRCCHGTAQVSRAGDAPSRQRALRRKR
jgi:hypothetical protein